MLSELFTEFDKRCVLHNIYKVYTIGDCYVVMGMNNANERNPLLEAQNVVHMARDMLEIIVRVRENIGFQELNMRIGIHTVFLKGSIIGGIIGTDVVRYDIYGPDVVAAPGEKIKHAKHESDRVDDDTYDYNPDLQHAFPTNGPPQPFLTDFSKIQR